MEAGPHPSFTFCTVLSDLTLTLTCLSLGGGRKTSCQTTGAKGCVAHRVLTVCTRDSVCWQAFGGIVYLALGWGNMNMESGTAVANKNVRPRMSVSIAWLAVQWASWPRRRECLEKGQLV